LISQKKNPAFSIETSMGIRDDLYKFWYGDLKKSGDCDAQEINDYASRRHSENSQHHQPALDKCFEKLNESNEYNYLREMFLIEYEICMNSAGDDSALKNVLNTFCFDVIIIKRLLIEYELCCIGNDTEITSTLCSMKNFNSNHTKYNLKELIGYVRKKISNYSAHSLRINHFSGTSHFIVSFHFVYSLIIAIFNQKFFY
jgi:hypothetical protein